MAIIVIGASIIAWQRFQVVDLLCVLVATLSTLLVVKSVRSSTKATWKGLVGNAMVLLGMVGVSVLYCRGAGNAVDLDAEQAANVVVAVGIVAVFVCVLIGYRLSHASNQ